MSRSPDELRRACAAAGIDVPDDDLHALAEMFENYLELAERVRRLAPPHPSTDVEQLTPFDARWT
jgi:hypothetical protein